jgi:hypothetical protein
MLGCNSWLRCLLSTRIGEFEVTEISEGGIDAMHSGHGSRLAWHRGKIQTTREPRSAVEGNLFFYCLKSIVLGQVLVYNPELCLIQCNLKQGLY